METDTMPVKRTHQGRSVRRLCEILGVKQDTLAEELAISQPALSRIVQKEVIEPEMREKIAKALKVPVKAIENFDEDAALNIFVNTLQDSSSVIQNYYPTFNAVDKVVELYERMLKAEQEKVAMLREMLEKK